MKLALLADSAVGEEVSRVARQALAVAVTDLELTAIHRSIRWFEVEDTDNRASISRHLLGYATPPRNPMELCPADPSDRLLGFIYADFGRHADLYVRRTRDPVVAAGVVLHEAAHSFQVGQAGGLGGARPYPGGFDAAEADARAYEHRMLARVSAIARPTPWAVSQTVRAAAR